MTDSYYYESIGQCVSQAHKIDAADWEAAKRAAIGQMSAGDIIAACPPCAVRPNESYPDYHEIDRDKCSEYATLCEGAWAVNKNGDEYWEQYAWFFSDDPEAHYDCDGNDFTDWD